MPSYNSKNSEAGISHANVGPETKKASKIN
jgi:hypothetical protein